MINLFKFIIGSVLGSFISLVNVRTFRHESILYPRSHCDYCQHQLKTWELIPIISFILLKGKCAKCHHSIDPSFLITEIISGLIILINPLTANGCFNDGVELILLLLSLCDYKSLAMPVLPIGTLIALALINLAKTGQNATILLITAIYLIISVLNYKHQLIGSGDIDIIFSLTLITGWQTVSIIVLIASLLSLGYYYSLKSVRLIPFVPFLSISYLITTEILSIKK